HLVREASRRRPPHASASRSRRVGRLVITCLSGGVSSLQLLQYAVPVGTRLSSRPPDRTGRAEFPHPAPTSGMPFKEPHPGPRMHDAGRWQGESLQKASPLSLLPPTSLAAALERPMPDA